MRDYGTAKWEGGSAECDHSPANTPTRRGIASSTLSGGKETTGHQREGYGVTCSHCGAHRVDAQIGLESTPAEYVAHIVAVMRECWRVLKDDGVLWLNLGDSYNSSPSNQQSGSMPRNNPEMPCRIGAFQSQGRQKRDVPGLKPKDLCGIPWRVAFALQEDGWYLRSDIIWSKPNPMPESVIDRPTKAHEYVFLLTKRERYYYDAEAIKDTASPNDKGRTRTGEKSPKQNDAIIGSETGSTIGQYQDTGNRNRRSVWTVATQPYSGAHFATFPPALIEPMILAGTSARGECPHCGKAWVRVVENGLTAHDGETNSAYPDGTNAKTLGKLRQAARERGEEYTNSKTTIGWRQQCACPPHESIPQTVLDPFAGSGTTGVVAVKHGRKAVLLDLNTKYIDLQFERNSKIQITMPM